MSWWRSPWARENGLRCLGLSLVALSFFFSLATALNMKMHKQISMWVVGSIPPALSRVAYGHDRHYMSLNFVHDSFYRQLKTFEADDLNGVMANILAENPVAASRSDRVLRGDDKGIVVATEAAFRLFGYRIEGLFYLYYIFLGISAALFVYAYWRNPFALLLLAAFLLLHRMVLPMIGYDPQLTSVTTLRCLPVLAMIACMHGVLFLFERDASFRKLFVLISQIALIVLVIHLRTTTMWVLMVVAGASLAFTLARKGPVSISGGVPGPFGRWPAAVPLLAAIVFMLALSAYRSYDFPEEYHRGGEIATRPVWPSVFMGLSYNPRFAKHFEPELRIDDVTTLLAVKQYLVDHGRAPEWEAMGGNSPDYAAMRWQTVDNVTRELLLESCSRYPADCITALAYYKPLSMLKTILWGAGVIELPPDIDLFVSQFAIGTAARDDFLRTSQQLDAHKARRPLWSRGLFVILVIFAVAAILRGNKGEMVPVIATAALLALGSTAPSVLGFPAPHTIIEAAIAIPLLAVLLAAYLVSWLATRKSRAS
jgi:hypothetical protein